MGILRPLLAATLLVLLTTTPTDASPHSPSDPRQNAAVMASRGAAIPPRGAPEPAWSGLNSLSVDEREIVRWAHGRFLLVGLEVPDVEIVFHPHSGDCNWNEGTYRSGDETRRIDVCVPDHGTSHSDLQRRRTVMHELAHAWDDVNLTEDDRDMLLPVLGAQEWYGPDLDWTTRGVERFAETIVWGLYDQRRRPTKINVPCAELHRAFVEITGHEPLGPIELACGLAAPTTGWSMWGDRGSNPGPTDYESAALTS